MNKADILERLLATEMMKMHPNEAIGYAWEYFNSCPFTWYGHSSYLNQRTMIQICGDETIGYPIGTVLHLTHDGDIYGTSESIDENGNIFGENPIFYYGHFEIDNHKFNLLFEELKNGKILFVPKPEASVIYQDMMG
jgi:hypothetical protein